MIQNYFTDSEGIKTDTGVIFANDVYNADSLEDLVLVVTLLPNNQFSIQPHEDDADNDGFAPFNMQWLVQEAENKILTNAIEIYKYDSDSTNIDTDDPLAFNAPNNRMYTRDEVKAAIEFALQNVHTNVNTGVVIDASMQRIG